jgi:cytochrome o ubiquinol oxidase subunit 3
MTKAKLVTAKAASTAVTPGIITKRYENDDKTIFGFWLYLMTDCVLFASLFAVYAVLHKNTFGGPGGETLFNLPYVLNETFILLTSSFTCGLAILAAQSKKLSHVRFWLGVTFVLGASFLYLELSEFHKLVRGGNSPHRSGFLSSYFTLVGTHGIHITVGLIWILVMIIRLTQMGLTQKTVRQLTLLSIFWHFLDVIWIFIFSIVYMFGGLGI